MRSSFLVERLDSSALRWFQSGSALLEHQPVARKVAGPKSERNVEIGSPVVEGRAGHAEDQVQRPAVKSRPHNLHGCLDLVASMIAFQNKQQLRPK